MYNENCDPKLQATHHSHLEDSYRELCYRIERLEIVLSGLTVDDVVSISEPTLETPPSVLGPSASPERRTTWTVDEHRRFVEALLRFGRQHAREIAQEVGTRTSVQVHSHTQKYFMKLQTIRAAINNRVEAFRFRESAFVADLLLDNIFCPSNLQKIQYGYFANYIGEQEIDFLPPLELLRRAAKHMRDLGFKGDLVPPSETVHCSTLVAALAGQESNGERSSLVRIVFSGANESVVTTSKTQAIITYNASHSLGYFELIACYSAEQAKLDERQLALMRLEFKEFHEQLQDSVYQNIERISRDYQIPEGLCCCLLMGLYVCDNFVGKIQ